jgi:molybdopterin converting factor small subunit
MLIKFFGPFNEKIGKDLLEFRIENEVTLNELFRRLAERFPTLKDYATGTKNYDILNSIFFVARNGALLEPGDMVRDEDELEIIAPVDGG